MPNYAPANPPLFAAHPKPIVHIGANTSGIYHQTNFSTSGTLPPESGMAEQGVLQYVASGAYTYTSQDGTVYTFNPSVQVAGALGTGVNQPESQRIASITYPDGRVRSFTYVSGKLKLVTDSTGYAIVLDYGSNGFISAACGFDLAHDYVTSSSTCSGAALKVSYTYTTGSPIYLSTVTDVLGNVITYSGGNGIGCITPPGYSSCEVSNVYTGFYSVTQTMADGAVWQVGWTSVNTRGEDYVAADGDNTATVTDPAGKVTNFLFTGTTPYSVTDANGHTTNYQYVGGPDYESTNTTVHDGSILTEVDLPEGNKYLAENQGPYGTISKETMKAKSGSGLADLVVNYGYSCPGGTLTPACTKPVTKQDPKGNVTDIVYTSFGAVQSEMAPAPSSGAYRPLKLYTYVQKYAYVKNSGGTLVAVSSPVWLPSTETQCQTVAGSSTPTCDSGAPQLVTTYEYGANGTADNLLVRGKVVSDGTTSLRTCMSYDAMGRKISETSPRAGLSGC